MGIKKKLEDMLNGVAKDQRENLNRQLDQADERLADVLKRLNDRLNQKERNSAKAGT